MRALQDMPISFPGLFGDWSFNPDPIAVHIGHGIYWYGIILAIGLLAGNANVVRLSSRRVEGEAPLLAALRRVLERLAGEGAVRPGYRTIALLDRALLEQAAEGQPTGEK